MSFRRFITTMLFFVVSSIIRMAGAHDITDPIPERDSVSRSDGNLIKTIIRYFEHTNDEKPAQKVDFSFIGGPSYSSDAQFGIGFVAAARYRHSLTDTVTPVSNVSLYGEITTALLYMIGVRGNHIAVNDAMRVNYDLKFYSFPTAFWGIGFDSDKFDSNKVKYKDFRLDIKAEAIWRLGSSPVYAGPELEFAHIKARDIKGPVDRWDGQPLTTTDFGLGFTAMYDTRDFITAPSRGWLLQLNQRFFPRFLGNNDHSFSLTEAAANFYFPAWKGSVIASRLHGYFTYGKTPWGLMGTLGGSYTMRGYYEARYRDKCAADFTVELRQHVWRRSGIVVWGGVGTVFPSFADLRWRRILPNAGIGYRWEFKKRTNVRLDFGIGRGQTGFVFNINEAF